MTVDGNLRVFSAKKFEGRPPNGFQTASPRSQFKPDSRRSQVHLNDVNPQPPWRGLLAGDCRDSNERMLDGLGAAKRNQ